jgi:hypothetical protein
MQTNSDLYLYLTRRDKFSVRILAKFQGSPQLPVRISDLSLLQLPKEWEEQLNQIIYESRMLWEPWIESEDSFQNLRTKLKNRGYANIPISAQPEFTLAASRNPVVNTLSLEKKTIMIQKFS